MIFQDEYLRERTSTQTKCACMVGFTQSHDGTFLHSLQDTFKHGSEDYTRIKIEKGSVNHSKDFMKLIQTL